VKSFGLQAEVKTGEEMRMKLSTKTDIRKQANVKRRVTKTLQT